MSSSPRVLLVVHNGFAARYLLRTAVVEQLRQAGAQVAILTPNHDEPYFVNEFAGPGVTLARLRLRNCEQVLRQRRFARTLERVHLYGTPTLTPLGQRRLRLQQAASRGRTGLYSFVLGVVTAALRRSKVARRLLLAWDRRHFPELHGQLFDAFGPNVVVTTSPGYASWPADAAVINEAQRRGIPTVAAVYAWDNPSTKGLPLARPDAAIAWSEIMRGELTASLDLPADRIAVTGPAIFDPYAEPAEDRGVFLRRFGLDPAKPLIFFGTMSPFRFPFNAAYVEAIARAIARGALAPCQMIVRLHPIYFRNRKRTPADDWHRLAETHPFLRLSIPCILSDRLPLDMPTSEMWTVASLVRHAAVVVSFFSTLQLEAAVADVPFVGIAFDHEDAHDGTRRPSWFDGHAHNRRTMESGAGIVARSWSDLQDGIRDSLEHPDRHSSARRRFALREAGPGDGQAGRRTADAILDLAR